MRKSVAVEKNSLGARIHTARRKAGLTQEELAYRTGVDRSTIQHYENNKTAPSVLIFRDLVQALNTTPDYLLYGGSRKTERCIDCAMLSDEVFQSFAALRNAIVRSL